MDKATKARKAARTWVTRASRALESVCSQRDVDQIALTDGISELDKRLEKLDLTQTEVEMETDIDKMEEEIESAAEFREKSRQPRVKAERLLAQMSPANTQSQGSDNSNQTNEVSGSQDDPVRMAKLPKLELPKFNGNVMEWQSFWDKFKAIVDSSDLPTISKFTYLESLLEGEAKSAIQGLSITASHYNIACDLLSERFGRKERIIFAHIQELLNMTVPSSTSSTQQSRVAALWKLQDDLQTHIRSLDALGVNGTEYGVILTPLILSRLPHDIRMEWAREGESRESDLAWLLDFLYKEIQRRERSQTFKQNNTGSGKSAAEERKGRSPTAAALHASNVNRCGFCDKRHPTEKCWDVTKLTIEERKEKIRAAGLCFRCLLKGHVARGCGAKCEKCKGRHHKLCCQGSVEPKKDRNGTDDGDHASRDVTDNGASPGNTHVEPCNITTCTNSVTMNTAKGTGQRRTVLQTARVEVCGKKECIAATVLFDSGSDRSYISSNLVCQVQPKWVSSQALSYAAFGAMKASKGEWRNVYKLDLKGNQGEKESLVAVEVPIICAPMYRSEIPVNMLSAFDKLNLAEDYGQAKQVSIDILIGLDYYWQFVKPNFVRIPQGLVAQDTAFGWIISGSWVGPDIPRPVVSHQLLCLNDIPETALRKFWDLESIGIYDQKSNAVDPVLDKFQEKLCFSDGRYEVALPWKDCASGKLLNNERLAKVRLNSLSRKLAKDPILEKRYQEALMEMEANGVIEEVPSGEIVGPYPTYYMPHRPVVRESSATTKIRPVFDASAQGYNGISLNDCLETGPNLIPNIAEILIRFRRWKVALTADITKAFLQVKVRREDQDVHRFLWDHEGTVRVMRFVRVPFGNRSSPFLLNATIRHHLSTFPSTNVVEELSENLYVDDWLSGADSEAEACKMFAEASEVMLKANMPLAKWGSNSDLVSEMCYREFETKYLDSESIKVLGIKWMAAVDCFSFDGIEIPSGLKITKRVILSFIARLFDPVGFLTPFVMLAKIIFQELWKLGLEWDEGVPEETQKQFTCWVKGIEQLRQWQIPRCYTGLPWKGLEGIELHGFGDASEKGYGACVYLRVPKGDGTHYVSLVISKAKVAPLKRVTLPRLELLGALLCARLLIFVRKALKLPTDVGYKCYTDSMVALGWIKSDPVKWKMFVANRVAEIQGLTSPSQWYHCPGKENPADLVTRGMLAKDLITSKLWLEGPEWLSSIEDMDEEIDREIGVDPKQNVEQEAECKNPSVEVSLVVIDRDQHKIFDVERWGNLCKAIRIVGWVRRFIDNCRSPTSKRSKGDLSFEEQKVAKIKLFSCVQRDVYSAELAALQENKGIPKSSSLAKLTPFIGKDGLLRVQGRLQFSELSYEARHPIILPNSHLSLLLVRFQHKIMKHAGVATMITALRDSYWIIGLRRLAKKVKRECLPCKKQDAKSCCQPMAPLPGLRTNRALPFSVTGLDYAGPLYCIDFPGKKFYILLCTCAVVRAVHLELTDTMSLADFMLALRRFSARRGLPSVIYSDNAKTFVGAQVRLQQYFGDKSPEWKFIVPRSPWWGGWWERLVRSVKSALKRSIGAKSLSRSELETTLQEVEACVNSRPLTFVGDEIDSKSPLTPSHFLTGRSSGFQSVGYTDPPVCTAQDLIAKDAVRQQMLDKFWFVWSSDYLRNLPPLKGSDPKGNVKVGSVVLVREDGYPRLQWPMGVITKVYSGRDGIVRSVDLKTAQGTITRSIQRLHDLELISEGQSEVSPSFNEASQAIKPVNTASNTKKVEFHVSRAGRVVKPTVKLDL